MTISCARGTRATRHHGRVGLFDRLDALDRRFGLKRGATPPEQRSWVKWVLLAAFVAVVAARVLQVAGLLSSGMSLLFVSIGLSGGAAVLIAVLLITGRRRG